MSDRIKNGIKLPYSEREELPYFYLIVADDEIAIELLAEQVKYLKGRMEKLKKKVK